MKSPLLAFYRFIAPGEDRRIPGYFAVSTAPDNDEDPDEANPLARAQDLQGVELVDSDSDQAIAQIAAELRDRANQRSGAELVIAIHGYNTGLGSVKSWYQQIWNYVNDSVPASGLVFVGYRWPSERVQLSTNLTKALKSLPILLGVMLFGGLIAAVASAVIWNRISLIFVVSLFLASIVLALVGLRVVGYFRDAYRATNFGVPDLVELVRQLDKALAGSVPDNSIRLSFIAHSMGGFVTTNVIRILSDVFDPSSVGETNGTGKVPSNTIGRVFCLQRLVLASPDIPAGSIITGRANFLRSSLRRFEEAYLFSNEGDLALRLASTAANYFSYPTNERIRGHRLGNVTVRPGNKADDPRYGVVNAAGLTDPTHTDSLINYLEINTLQQSVMLKDLQKRTDKDDEMIADAFTYFDCTNYVDRRFRNGKWVKEQNVLSYRFDRFPPALSFLNTVVYLALIFAWQTGKLDVHGGYFEGEFSRELVYKLGFIGFQNFLLTADLALPEATQQAITAIDQKVAAIDQTIHSLEGESSQPLPELMADRQNSEARKRLLLFEQFSAKCQQRQIQAVFSPKRYRADVSLR